MCTLPGPARQRKHDDGRRTTSAERQIWRERNSAATVASWRPDEIVGDMTHQFISADGTFEVSVRPVVVAASGPAGDSSTEPSWSDLPDDLLVTLSGLAGQRAVAGGWTLPHPFGFVARAELDRRLATGLAGFRADASSNAIASERLSRDVIKLTRQLIFLNWALVVAALVTIVVAIAR